MEIWIECDLELEIWNVPRRRYKRKEEDRFEVVLIGREAEIEGISWIWLDLKMEEKYVPLVEISWN